MYSPGKPLTFAVPIVALYSCLWLNSAPAAVQVTIGQNFSGSSDSSDPTETPADADGVVGPRHFVEFVNGAFAVYNKTNGAMVKKIADTKFWSNAGVVLATSDRIADPRIVYDPLSQRWFASMVDFDGNASDPSLESNDFLLAVSLTSDPTGGWKGFLFQADPDNGTFADFPTLGVDASAVYLSGDMYQGMNNPLGPSLWSFPKADLVSAPPTIANATWFGVMDYDVRGDVLQPANCFDGSVTGRILATTDIGNDSDPHSNFVTFAVLNGGAPGATLTPASLVATPPWVVPDNPYLGVPYFPVIQPDGTDTLVGNEARLSAKVYAVGGFLYAVNSTDVNGRVGIQWYRIRAADNSLVESGIISDPDLDLIFPSIAANQYGVVTIGFNASGAGTYVSCYAIVGQTVNGVTTFGTRLLLSASFQNYHDFSEEYGLADISRWGDYTTTSVDPNDQNRFWTIQMTASREPNDLWDVWVTQMTELITTPAVSLAIKRAGTNVMLSWPSGIANFQLQSATNLVTHPAWSNVTLPAVTNAGQVSVLVPASTARKFFRLQKL